MPHRTHTTHPASCYPLLGAHILIQDGLAHAIAVAQELQCTAIQIFTHSNRQWSFRPPSTPVIDSFTAAWQASGVCRIVVHGSYLMNPATNDPDLRAKTVTTLVKEIETCDLLGIDTLVLHPGSRKDQPLEHALQQCAAVINHALEKTPTSKVRVLVETMAGQGSTIGTTFEELAYIVDRIENQRRVGVCLDTCHIAAAGYPCYSPQEYKDLWHRFNTVLGAHRLHLIHVNDSATAPKSHVDRHAHIGQGSLGLDFFRHIMQDPHLHNIPKILETPKDDALKDDKKNLALLHSLLHERK